MTIMQFIKYPAIAAGLFAGFATGMYYCLLAYKIVPYHPLVTSLIILFPVIIRPLYLRCFFPQAK